MLSIARLLVFASVGVLLSGLASKPSSPAIEGNVPEVHFDLKKNEIFIRVRIGGQGPFTMLLDDNTDPSTIDLAFARSHNLKLSAVEGEATGGGSGHPQMFLTTLPSVQLGPVEGKDVQAIALDLARMSKALGEEIQGVLGNSFLSGRVVQIDYPQHVIRFLPSGATSGAAGSTASQETFPFSFDEDDGCVLIQGVAVNGTRVTATLDTGSDGEFSLTPRGVELLNLGDVARAGQPQDSVGYKGDARNTKGTVGQISLGHFEVQLPNVVFFGVGSGRDHKPWQLNIGNAFLKDFILTIDYPRKLVTLQKIETHQEMPEQE